MDRYPTAVCRRGDRPRRPDARWFSKPLLPWRRLSPGRWRGLPATRRPLRSNRDLSPNLRRLFAGIAQRPVADEGDDEESASPGN